MISVDQSTRSNPSSSESSKASHFFVDAVRGMIGGRHKEERARRSFFRERSKSLMALLILSTHLSRDSFVEAEKDLVEDEDGSTLLSPPATISKLYVHSLIISGVEVSRASIPIAIFLSRIIIVDGVGIVKCQLTRRRGTSTS
jgi:hypothetical protein